MADIPKHTETYNIGLHHMVKTRISDYFERYYDMMYGWQKSSGVFLHRNFQLKKDKDLSAGHLCSSTVRHYYTHMVTHFIFIK